MSQASAPTQTVQSNLFWIYSAGGVPIVTYVILAATTVVLATSTLAMSEETVGMVEPSQSTESIGGSKQKTTKRMSGNKTKRSHK